jgi:hypothetical protein
VISIHLSRVTRLSRSKWRIRSYECSWTSDASSSDTVSTKTFASSVRRSPVSPLSTLANRSPAFKTDIYIPPSQIIDTVNIYHLAHRQRKLSLRFLAWAVLHSAIQADTHDSIEDARTALQLYEEHNRLEAEGSWEEVLEEVYREGRQTVRLSLSPSCALF